MSDDWAPFAEPPVGTHPPLDAPAYRSTARRAPSRPLVRLPAGLADPTELTGPVFGHDAVTAADAGLTVGPTGEAVGQRIIVTGRLLDGAGRPIRQSLIEVWQANASGRYRHRGDRWPGALDPNFTGGGRVLTDDDGGYRFTTIKPGAYPWGNHENAWRPAHIHFSLFGTAFDTRLVTQMYFPGDPLFEFDPIFQSVRNPKARSRLVCGFELEETVPEWALGYRFDIVLGGPAEKPLEP